MITEKRDRLHRIYQAFESRAARYKENAACGRGCAYCCTDAGSIHITTLEGLVIRDIVERLPAPRRKGVRKAIAKEMQRREKGTVSACPFLMKNRACMIYPHRPFACRRVYSLHACDADRPPVLSRRVMEMGDEAIRQLQRLDDTGYTGHLSYILYMLEAPKFLRPYLEGAFKPEEIMDFGRSHGIIINRMASK
jgi:hypothetical protein